MKRVEEKLAVPGLRCSAVLWVILLTLLIPLPSWSDTAPEESPARLMISLEKTVARVGDLLWVTLSYELPEGATLSEKTDVKGLESLTVIEQKRQTGEINIRILVDQLTAFEIGPVTLTYTDTQANKIQIESATVSMTILSNLGDTPGEATLKPIRDIIPMAPVWIPYLWAALLTCLVMGIIAGSIWWHKKHQAGKNGIPPEDPPHVRAEKEIADLLASNLFDKGDVKTFYFMFSETLRRYMEAIRQYPAAEMTTEEITRIAGKDPSDQHILPLLRQADLVKFADSIPAPDRKDQDILMARTYIRKTRPMPDDPKAAHTHREDRK